jgi:hypothetical protein
MAEPQDSVAPPDAETAPADVAAPSPAPKVEVKRVERRRGGVVWPLIGGVLAAGLGFALARAVPGGWPIADTTALQAQVQQLAADDAALKSQLAALAAAPAAPSDLADRVAALESKSAPDLSADLAALKNRVDALASTPGAGDGAALKALQDQVAALSAAPVAIPAEIEAAVKAAKDQLSAATAEAQAQAGKLTTLSAWRQLAAALDSGAPFAAALGDLSGQTLPAVLTDNAQTGLPTMQSLRDSFPEAARAALEAARRADMGASWTDRIATFLQTQTGARSLTPRDGSDPDAVLSRAEAAVAKADLATALTEIAALPDAAKAALADWQAQATRRLQAGQAIADLGKALGQ